MRALEKELKALANRRRLAILKHLKSHPEVPVGDIADAIKLSLKATSKHLAVLAALDIVDREQRSLQMFYYLNRIQKPSVRYILSLL